MTTAPLTRLPAAVLDKHLAFLATSDAGKTYGAKGEVERLLDAGKRVCVIDPTSVWWGLRLKPDFETPSKYSLPIFGGCDRKGRAPGYADVPIGETAGDRLAELVAGGDFSCIVDVGRMTAAGRTRFLADFAETLSAESRRPLHLVVDEAHVMMPQTIFSGDVNAARMLGAANNMVSGGRAQGLRIMLLTQRPAKLHNDSLTQVQTVVAMFNMAPADIAPVKKWLAINADPARAREILASLPTLPVGQGWVYAPRLGVLDRIAFGPIHTADSSRAPSDDDADREPAHLGALDLEAIRAALAIEPAAAAPGTPAGKGLQEAERRTLREAALAEGVEEGRRQEREALGKSLATHPEVQQMIVLAERAGRIAAAKDFRAGLVRLTKWCGEEIEANSRPPAVKPKVVAEPAPAAPPAPRPAPAVAAAPKALEKPAAAAGEPAELPDAAHALINAARSAHRPLTWAEAAVLAGRIPQGGSFEAARRRLLDAGWREPVPNDLAGDSDLALSRIEVLDSLEPKVGAAKKASPHAHRGFRVLAEAGRASREELAAVLGIQPRGGHFEHLWRTLRTSPLLEEVEDGRLDVIPILRELRAIAEEAI